MAGLILRFMTELSIEKNTTALVVIDLQKGIAGFPNAAPRSSQEVIANASKLAGAFRAHGMPVFLVRVVVTPEIALRPIADEIDLCLRDRCPPIGLI